LTADATFALEHTEEGAGCYGWRLQAVSWPSGGARRASEVVASPQCRPFRGRFVAQKRARKRGNLSIIDNVRTNAQQHTQHAQDTPQNDSCGQLQTMCDCPAVFSASSVHASGQRRPFRRAFKSQMRSSRLPGHLKVTLTLRSNQASSPMTLRLRRRGKEVEKGVDRPQVAGGKSSGGV
jgi:hypothetical protein